MKEARQIIALSESWAYHMGHFYSDRKYALFSSDAIAQGFRYTNNATTSSHIRLLESYDPNLASDPDRWIPIGVYLDLIDINNEPGPIPVIDNVSTTTLSFTNQLLFNALDPDIRTMLQYRDRLVGKNPTNQPTQVRDLFAQYNIR